MDFDDAEGEDAQEEFAATDDQGGEGQPEDSELADIEDENEGDEELAAEAHDDEDHAPKFTKTTNPKADPLLKTSNTHRKVIILAGDDRMTSNVLQRSEAAHIIAVRAKQIESFPTSFGDTSPVLGPALARDQAQDSVARAKHELLTRKTPLRLRRFVGYGSQGEIIYEEWNIREMAYAPLE